MFAWYNFPEFVCSRRRHFEKQETGPHQIAEAQPAGGKSEKKISSQILSNNPGVCSQRRCLICEQIFVIANLQEIFAFFEL